MIKEIRLKNFQAHTDSVISFDNGVNAIIGASSQGKTSIIRAISWVLTNRPTGDGYVNYGALDSKGKITKESSVEIITDNHSVKRIKDKGLNAYIVDGEVLSCIGTDVPEKVLSVLKMGDLNLQEQLDPHFLLSNSAGEVARYLNTLVNLSIIDGVLTEASREQKNNKASVESVKKQITESEESLSHLSTVEREGEIVNQIDSLVESYNSINSTTTDLENNIPLLIQFNEAIKEKEQLNYAIENIGKINEVSNKIDSLNMQINTIESLLNNYVVSDTVLQTKQNVEASLAIIAMLIRTGLDITANEAVVSMITEIIRNYKEYSSILEESSKVSEAVRCIEKIDSIEKQLVDLRTLYGSIVGDLKMYNDFVSQIEGLSKELEEAKKELPDTCPTCGGKMGGIYDSCK